MLKKLFKRTKSQKGMSGVLVALLLVVIGVGLVAGLNRWMVGQKDNILAKANNHMINALK